MSIIQGLLDIIEQEMKKNEVTRLIRVKVVHGQMAGVVPDALTFAWEAMTKGTCFDGAILDNEERPVILKCGGCGKEFEPVEQGGPLQFTPCPDCEEQLGHEVVSGRELYLEQLEAE